MAEQIFRDMKWATIPLDSSQTSQSLFLNTTSQTSATQSSSELFLPPEHPGNQVLQMIPQSFVYHEGAGLSARTFKYPIPRGDSENRDYQYWLFIEERFMEGG